MILLVSCLVALAFADAPLDAILSPGCSPWDGPAVRLEIPDAKIAVSFYRKIPGPGALSITFDGTEDSGNGVFCEAPGTCTRADKTTVTFTEYGKQKASGSYKLIFSDGKVREAKFQAKWKRGRPPSCG